MDLVKPFCLFLILGVLGTSSASYAQTCDPGADGITPVGGGTQNLLNGDVCANNASTAGVMQINYNNVDDGGDPNNVEFFIDWDDGTTQTLRFALGEITQPAFPPNSYEATVTHFFPPNGGAVQCEYIPTTFLQFNGTACPGSAANPPAFVRWNTDDELTGQHLLAEQATGNTIYEVCAGESVTVFFSDQSTFNCVPPAYLNLVNDRTRWTQFIYGTNNTITSGTGVEVAGTIEAYPFNGAVLSQATPVMAPFAVTLDITVPNDALVGEEFEITMNSWNFCNQFTNGDPPIVTTGIIRIIGSPVAPVVPPTDFCVGQDPTTAAAGGGGAITWYTDLGLTNIALVGNPFDPTSDPAPIDQLSNLVPGSKTYYVTETLGVNNCEGPATAVLFNIIENPTASAAGANFSVCTATSALSANMPVVGVGVWTSSGPGVADAPINPLSTVSGLVSGTTTTFTWTITNGGICVDANTVDVTRDLPPSPADVGPDISLCTGTTVNMNAVVPLVGIGTWTVTIGPGNVLAGDENLPTATIENLTPGINTTLQWEVNNLTCMPPTIPANTSTVQIINFLDPAPEAGAPIFICDPMTTGTLAADDPTLSVATATGLWTVSAGPGNVVLGDETLFNANIENLVLGMPTTFTWTVSNGVCVDFDDVIVTIEAAPTVSTATTPLANICSATSTVTGEVPLSGTGLWSIDAGTGNIVVGEEGFVTANVENMVPGTTTTFRWTISTVSCALTSATVDITNTSPTTSLAGSDQNVCVATERLVEIYHSSLRLEHGLLAAPEL